MLVFLWCLFSNYIFSLILPAINIKLKDCSFYRQLTFLCLHPPLYPITASQKQITPNETLIRTSYWIWGRSYLIGPSWGRKYNGSWKFLIITLFLSNVYQHVHLLLKAMNHTNVKSYVRSGQTFVYEVACHMYSYNCKSNTCFAWWWLQFFKTGGCVLNMCLARVLAAEPSSH